MMVRELGFEMKAQPSEKMKTPEELAKEEKEKLQKLEVTTTPKPIRRSSLLLSLFRPFCGTELICLTSLQADRLRRMMGDEGCNGVQRQVHISADDLNDGFVLDKHDKKTLSYQVSQLQNRRLCPKGRFVVET